MRLALGGFALETVTFMPGENGLAEFEAVALRGERLLSSLRGSSSPAGGMIDACEEAGVELLPLVHTDTGAGPPASEEAFQHYLDEITEGILGGISTRVETAHTGASSSLDGVLLFLHGAMATPERPHAELDFLQLLRERIGPELPISLAMDLHGNIDPDILEHVTALFSYHHSPHIDMAETGRRAATALIRTLRGEIQPRVTLRKVPLVLPSIFTATEKEPLAAIMAAARDWERQAPGFLDLSIFTGFAYADVPQVGFTVVAVSDGETEWAGRAVDDLAGRIAEQRERLYAREPVLGVEEGVSQALASIAGGATPVVLLEHADRGNDSTYTLRRLLRETGLRAAVPYLCDPLSVEIALRAGPGARVELEVGGRSSPQAGGPVKVTGTVRWAGEKSYVGTGPLRKGVPVDLGPTAVIDADGIVLILTSASLTALDLDPFGQFGLNPREFDLILLRSKTHFRAVYEPLASEIIIIDTPDWGPADLTTLPYRNVRPGVYPIT